MVSYRMLNQVSFCVVIIPTSQVIRMATNISPAIASVIVSDQTKSDLDRA